MVNRLTVQLTPSGAWVNVALVEITNAAGSTVYGSAVPGGDQVDVWVGSLAVPVGPATTYMVRITPRTHAAMPAPNLGQQLATGGTVVAAASTNARTYADTASATVTIDNAAARRRHPERADQRRHQHPAQLDGRHQRGGAAQGRRPGHRRAGRRDHLHGGRGAGRQHRGLRGQPGALQLDRAHRRRGLLLRGLHLRLLQQLLAGRPHRPALRRGRDRGQPERRHAGAGGGHPQPQGRGHRDQQRHHRLQGAGPGLQPPQRGHRPAAHRGPAQGGRPDAAPSRPPATPTTTPSR